MHEKGLKLMRQFYIFNLQVIIYNLTCPNTKFVSQTWYGPRIEGTVFGFFLTLSDYSIRRKKRFSEIRESLHWTKLCDGMCAANWFMSWLNAFSGPTSNHTFTFLLLYFLCFRFFGIHFHILVAQLQRTLIWKFSKRNRRRMKPKKTCCPSGKW